MNDVDIQKSFIERFKTLNTFSGIEFITDENVAYPNITFKQPADKRYFNVNFLANEPEGVGVLDTHLDRWSGIFQIDICTPLNVGEDEVNTKYKWISKLFARGTMFDDVVVNKVYRATKMRDNDVYKTVIRIEWDADTDNSKE